MGLLEHTQSNNTNISFDDSSDLCKAQALLYIYIYVYNFNRPGVAGAVLQTPL